MKIFEEIESEVQSYARSFPRIFNKAKGEFLYDEEGNAYLDFLAGAGTLNYGHNNPLFKETLLDYIHADGITHGLDLHTKAKGEFMEAFNEKILKPRQLEYVMQFTGPTGTNAVEAALKLARNVTGRENVIAFTNGFHGVSLGALAATGNSHHRGAAGVSLSGTSRIPYDGYLGDDIDTTAYLDKVLSDSSSGVDKPAAVIVETVQGEGGINVASVEWLRNLDAVCKKHEVLLIVDDIHYAEGHHGDLLAVVGNGRVSRERPLAGGGGVGRVPLEFDVERLGNEGLPQRCRLLESHEEVCVRVDVGPVAVGRVDAEHHVLRVHPDTVEDRIVVLQVQPRAPEYRVVLVGDCE